MSKIIIHNKIGLDDLTALKYIERVIEKGKCSHSYKGDQYCFVTIYEKPNGNRIVVTCDKNGQDTYTFKIYSEDN